MDSILIFDPIRLSLSYFSCSRLVAKSIQHSDKPFFIQRSDDDILV